MLCYFIEGGAAANAKKQAAKRDLYLKRMIAFQDTEMIKVVTGIRRCGKSSLMKLMAQHLRESGVADDQILEMNFESMSIPDMDARGFYEYVKARICPDKRTYLFFDEVQKVPGWENAVNSFRVDFDCDIYITGSNAYLLSSELSTYLSGRYVEIKVLPLSFREFLDFHGYTLTERKSPAGGVKKRVMDADGEIYDAKELFDAYARFGGMPMLADIGLEIDRVTAALDGVYSAAVVNNILEREKRRDSERSPMRYCSEKSSCFWRTTSATIPPLHPLGTRWSARACWRMESEKQSQRCRRSRRISKP